MSELGCFDGNSPLTINENGKRKIITKDEGIAKQVVNKALGGHVQSMRLVDNWRRQALEKAAEEQQRAQYMTNRTVKELTDEELTLLIRAHLDESTPDGSNGRKPGNRGMIGE